MYAPTKMTFCQNLYVLKTIGIEFQCTQREVYGHNTNKPTIFDVKDYLTSLSGAQGSLLSQVHCAVKLIFVMPANNATSERSFRVLRWVKR